MIDGTYKIRIQMLLGAKYGRVVLQTKGDKLRAKINAPVIGRQIVRGHVDGDTFTAKGSGMAMLVGRIDYDIKGEVSGDDLYLEILSNKGNFTFEGTRV